MAEISKITLPSGNTYDLKDAVARQMISGGVSFIVAWDGVSVPTVANIPAGVKVTYNDTEYTGTMDADDAQAGAFYLVKSSTQAGGTSDAYDEYVPVGTTGSKTWEKIGDTQIDLTDVVTDVTLNQSTTNFLTGLGTASTSQVVGKDATFTVTQPELSTVSSGGTEVVTSGTETKYIIKVSGANTAWNSKDNVVAVTGFNGDPTTDTFVKSVSAETGESLVTSTIAGSNAITGVTDNTSKLVTTSVTPAGTATSVVNSVTDNTQNLVTADAITAISPTTAKMVTTSIYGVGSTTTSALYYSASSTQTTYGSYSVVASVSAQGSANDSWLKAVYYDATNENLMFGAADLVSQTTHEYTFTNVAVPIKNTNSTTLATGALSTNGAGSTVATGLGTPTKTAFATGALSTNGAGAAVMVSTTTGTSNVATVGTAVTLATGALAAAGSGAAVMTSTTKASAKFISASTITFATGETSTTGSGASVVTGVTIGTTAAAITSLPGFTTKSAIGSAATFTITQPTATFSTSTTGTAFITAVGKSNLSVGGANVAWSNQKLVTAVTGYASPTSVAGLNTGTSITVTKGS